MRKVSTADVGCLGFATRAEAERAIVGYIGYYNTRHRHSALVQITPAEIERRWHAQQARTAPVEQHLRSGSGLLDSVQALWVRKGKDLDGKSAPAAHWMNQTRRPGGHFAGIQFFHDRIDSSRWPYYLASPASATVATTMADIEAVLAAHAVALGVEIRRGLSVDGFDASDEQVAVRAGTQTFNARWLVGCDGGRSTVRKAGGQGCTPSSLRAPLPWLILTRVRFTEASS